MLVVITIILTTMLLLGFLALVLYKPNPQMEKPKKGFLYTWIVIVLIYSTCFFLVNFFFPPNNWLPSLFGLIVYVTFVSIFLFIRYKATKL